MSEVCRRNLENIFLTPFASLRRQTLDISCQMKVNFHFPTFSPRFEEACKELNIPLYVLPPYSPKQNGRIEAQSRKMMCLHNHFNLLLGEAQSQTETSLLDFGSLSFSEVLKRLKGARSTNGAKRQTNK